MEIGRDSLLKRMKKGRSAYLFLLPTVSLIAIFKIKPVIEGIITSFYEAGIKTRSFVGFANYTKMADDPLFWQELINTFIFVAAIVPATIAISLFIALVISKFKSRLQSFFRATFYLPAVAAGIVTGLVWLWIFHPGYGLMNYLLSLLGISPIFWLGQANSARLAIIIVLISQQIGIPILLYLSALAAIPNEIYEAAEIDGAGSWQKFFKVSLPLIVPTTAFILVMHTIARIQIFSLIYLLTKGGPAYSTISLAYRIFQLGFTYFRFGEASAHGVVLLSITFTIAFFQFRYLSRKLEY